jgi:C-terminal processing protease CtpA/Prc
MFDYMVADGYEQNVNYIRLSASFPYFHRNIFGLYKNYYVNYTDSNGLAKSALLPYYAPSPDSVKKEKRKRRIERRRIPYEKRLESIRSLQHDSLFTLMTINGFSKGHLRSFFRRSFRELRKKGVENLVIDLRANGGGDINKSVLLTKYLKNTSFKVADSAYSISKNFAPYTKNISFGFLNNLGLLFVTRKKKDGAYHFGYWERHTFIPKRRNHFDGKVFVLTNGLTFSASSLFCSAVKGQDNITLAGEETGGGWYGNSGILIPEITLPNTRLRVRLPFFRLVQYQHQATIKGAGVIPDIYVGPDWRDVLHGVDTKMKTIEKIIEEGQK